MNIISRKLNSVTVILDIITRILNIIIIILEILCKIKKSLNSNINIKYKNIKNKQKNGKAI